MRLNRYLALCGIASRRHCDELINEGLVSVNDKVCLSLGTRVEEGKDKVTYKKKTLSLPSSYSYFIFHKPKYCISSKKDPQNRKTIFHLLKNIDNSVFSVGRLDYNSEGLILLTNDGELTNRLLHPRYSVEKEYFLKARGFISNKQIEMINQGIELEEGLAKPISLKLISRSESSSSLRITITQGWKRQIRRMLQAVDIKITLLRRERFASLRLFPLKKGEYRKLTEKEVSFLKRQYSSST